MGQPPLLGPLSFSETSLQAIRTPLSAAAQRRRHPLVLNRLQPMSFASEQRKAAPAALQTEPSSYSPGESQVLMYTVSS